MKRIWLRIMCRFGPRRDENPPKPLPKSGEFEDDYGMWITADSTEVCYRKGRWVRVGVFNFYGPGYLKDMKTVIFQEEEFPVEV